MRLKKKKYNEEGRHNNLVVLSPVKIWQLQDKKYKDKDKDKDNDEDNDTKVLYQIESFLHFYFFTWKK